MKVYEPVNLAMPLAKELGERIMRTGRLPEGEEVRGILKKLELEESCLDRGVGVYRSRNVVALVFAKGEALVVDVISSSGELSDAMEVIAYHDRQLNAFIVEILPANDIEYEGNIGIEPVIIDAEKLELESSPVLGHFEEDEEGVFLIIDRETYVRWKENGDLNTCPVCGGELAWKGERAYCQDCGYGVKVKG
jgi:ribosomal protein S27AE